MKMINKDDQTDLDKIILILADKYNIDRIFLNTYYAADVTFYELVILLSNKEHRSVGELDPQINMSLKDFPKFHHVTLVGFQVKSKLIDGNLYLHMICHPDKLIYQNPASTFNLYPEGHSPENTLASVNELFERENHKVNEFKEGYYYFKERNSLSHAGFMLHQVFELRYRCTEIMVMGKDRPTHSIRSHHRYLVRMAPSLATIFKEGKPEDETLLCFLENVYKAARYENDFDPDMDILLQLENRMETFMDLTDTLFQQSVTDFKHYSSPYNSRETIVPESQEDSIDEMIEAGANPSDSADNEKTASFKLTYIVDSLRERLDDVCGIYLFGQRTRSFRIEGINEQVDDGVCDFYFDLLIVSENDIREQIGHAQASINQTDGISVLLLSFTKEQIQKQLDKNNPFFHRALQYAEPLFLREDYPLDWSFHENNGIRTEEEEDRARTKWFVREENASGFYNGGCGIDDPDQVRIRVFLYNQAIEQACLGLLEYFYGYQPYNHNLKHLYGLCSSFWTFPNDIFPRVTQEDKELFDELTKSVNNTRYLGWAAFDWDEAYRYEGKCRRFLTHCSDLVRVW